MCFVLYIATQAQPHAGDYAHCLAIYVAAMHIFLLTFSF